jgi:hypothetical protein
MVPLGQRTIRENSHLVCTANAPHSGPQMFRKRTAICALPVPYINPAQSERTQHKTLTPADAVQPRPCLTKGSAVLHRSYTHAFHVATQSVAATGVRHAVICASTEVSCAPIQRPLSAADENRGTQFQRLRLL